MPARIFGLRLSLFYAFLFLGLGVQLPFLPLWLKDRGLSEGETAMVLAAMIAVRIPAAPLGAFIADRHGNRRRVIVASAILSVLFYALMPAMHGFWPIILTGVAAQACYSPIVPLAENIAVEGSLRHRIDYGRMRLWGSLSFIIGSLGGGSLLSMLPVADIILMILAGQTVLMIATLILPGEQKSTAATPSVAPLQASDALRLFALPAFAAFLLAASLDQSSHGLLYTFGSVHWDHLGYTKPVIGLLWGIGVIAEMTLFFFSGRLMKRFGPVNLIVIGSAGATLRWLIMGIDPFLLLLVPAQAMHGLSFSAAHLGTMHYIQRFVPANLRNTAQGLYSAASGGLAMSLSMLASGPLYRWFAGEAYFAMALIAVAGLLLALNLKRVNPTAPPERDA